MRRGPYVAVGLAALGGCSEPLAHPRPEGSGLFQGGAFGVPETAWRGFTSSSSLHAAWTPPASSPWKAYYRPTLPASASIVSSAARPVAPTDDRIARLVEQLVTSIDLNSAAVVVDLPGEESVAWGAHLAKRGLQPLVCVNNWPHPKGLVPLERTLGALMYWAPTVLDAKARLRSIPSPVFILDNRRLQPRTVRDPHAVFDNRYFHLASDLPEAVTLKSRGFVGVVYIRPSSMGYPCEDDLVDAFVSLKTQGLNCWSFTVDGSGGRMAAWTPVNRTTAFSHGASSTYASPRSTHHRSYAHYVFWSRSRSTWGSPSSGGGRSTYS